MKTLIIILGIFFFNTLIGQERVYNSDKTFSIIPLKYWEDHSKETSLVFAQPLENNSDIFQENIRFNEHPANGKNLNELWDMYVLKDFPKSFDNYKMIEMWDSNINGKKAKWIDFTNTENNIKYRNLVYMLVENNRTYYIVCTAIDDKYLQVEKEFRQMINSFEIN